MQYITFPILSKIERRLFPWFCGLSANDLASMKNRKVSGSTKASMAKLKITKVSYI